MFQFLLLAILAAVAWRKVAPPSHFVELFALLLQRPERAPRGLFGWLRGIESVGGEYGNRPVTLVVRHKRGKHSMGFLTLAMAAASSRSMRIENGGRTAGLHSIFEVFTSSKTTGETARIDVQASDARAATAWLARPDVKSAVDALVVRHDLSLAVEGGWLRATWMPIGFFIFPGRFDAEKWRHVLAQMQALAAALDDAANTSSLPPGPLSRNDGARLPA